MRSRSLRYLLTLLAFTLVFLPGYIQQALHPGTELILSENRLLGLFISRIPALFLLISMIFSAGRNQNNSTGLVPLEITDLPAIGILVILTLGIGALLPLNQQKVFLEIHSVWGVFLITGLAVATAAIEELYFRSWLLTALPFLGWPKWTAAVFSILLFSSGHFWEGFAAVSLAIISGTLYTIFFLKKQSILPLIIAHSIHNTVVLGLYAIR